MQNKKFLITFILIISLAFTTKALASLTFSSAAITGTASSTLDLGAGNDLYIQTSGGKVGIGTATPNNILQVSGLINFNDIDYNTIIGKNAGANVVTGAQYNTFLGYEAGRSGADGGTNTVDNNTAVGYQSLASYTTGRNTTGNNNTSIGYNSLKYNATGYNNTASGSRSLYFSDSGYKNTGNGYRALYYNTTGYSSTASGNLALYYNEGSNNTAYGDSGLFSNISGNNNTIIGSQAMWGNETGSNNVALGYYAGFYETGSNAFYVDNQNRTNTAGDKAGALLYGTFNATPANQTLKINGNLYVNSALNKGTCVLGTSCASITVASGAICTATDTTGIFATRAVVSGTTLTITGNGTDTIAYTCL